MTRKIAVAEPVLDGNEADYVLDCIKKTWISSRGVYIERFETMLAEYCGVKSAVVTNNGTTALHLALVASGVSAGDEVIMPTLTYIATANAVRYCNATPVFVDSEPDYFNVDPAQIEGAITPRTKAILTVPLYGHPVDFDPIVELANRYGLLVIEDSAEALGAQYRGRPVGSLGHCSTFSFFGNKLITTGEGGAIVTNDTVLAERMRFLRGQGVSPDRRYWHPEVGYNYRMTNVAAAIGVAQMERINEHLSRRAQVAQWYDRFLEPLRDEIQLPKKADWAEHSYWMYTILLKPHLGIDRDTFMTELATTGIETRPIFYPVHTMPPYFSTDRFPVAEAISRAGVNLPTHGNLTQLDVRYVCDKVEAKLDELRRRGYRQANRAA